MQVAETTDTDQRAAARGLSPPDMLFVETTDTDQGLPPYRFPGVSIRMFVLSADLDAMNAYCDKILNGIRSEFRFRAFLPYVYLGINIYPKMYSDYPGFKAMGYTRQKEFYLTFPVMRYDLGWHNLFLPIEYTWFFPFIGVDNPTSAFTGREVLGFQKHVGLVNTDTATDGSFSADVSMPAFRVLDDDERQEELPLISVRTGPQLANAGALDHQFPWSLLNLDQASDGLDEMAKLLLEATAPGIMSVTNLKQFRDGESPLNAAYKALVRSEFGLANMKPAVLYDGADIKITDDPNYPIVAVLGISGGATPKPLLSMGLEADMSFGKVTNICVAA